MSSNINNLPKDFCNKMQSLLGEEYEAFLEGYDRERQYGMRRNRLKISQEEFEKLEFVCEKIPWAEEGYYYNNEMKPGKHPYHEAGLYYIQEPSAMSVAELIDVKPGERVLDLCAAPGGKSTQAACKMEGQGILVSNEINPARAKILSQNIERLGIKNAIVLNEDSGRLAEVFVEYFDKIIVDAPCSGEGMFRKDENAASEWSVEQVNVCAERQKMIIANAAKMLKPGGRMVYSTCTFSPEENEQVIQWFLNNHEGYSIAKCDTYKKFSTGNPAWIREDEEKPATQISDMDMNENNIGNLTEDIANTIRLWPHKLGGEGHFAAVIQKAADTSKAQNDEGQSDSKSKKKLNKNNKNSKGLELSEFKKFAEECLNTSYDKKRIIAFGEQLYYVPEDMVELSGLKVVRPGLHLGTNKKNRFEPSHALALNLKASDVKNVIELDLEDAKRYMQGNPVECNGDIKGWALVTVDGYSMAWAKCSGGTAKNHYPKGLRLT